jgi:hypothetical protein
MREACRDLIWFGDVGFLVPMFSKPTGCLANQVFNICLLARSDAAQIRACALNRREILADHERFAMTVNS